MSKFRKDIESELKGKTLKVYLYLLQKREGVGPREVQRALNFSSPSLAMHHLEKLIRLGIVTKDNYGRYFVEQKVDVGILQAFVRVFGFTLPRYTFYASFFTTLLFSYILISFSSLNLYALISLLSSSIAFWYETFRTWKRRPF
jgi:predicted DNA-binding transcriptional regulator